MSPGGCDSGGTRGCSRAGGCTGEKWQREDGRDDATIVPVERRMCIRDAVNRVTQREGGMCPRARKRRLDGAMCLRCGGDTGPWS